MSASVIVVTDSPAGTCITSEEESEGNECGSDVHCWVYEDALRTCSLFAGIQVQLVSLGDKHALIVSTDYRVFSVGANDYGQLGLGDRVNRKTPREIGFLTEKCVTAIACGSRHNSAIGKKGQVFCWGDSRQGQCGQGENGIFTTPCRVQFTMKSQSSFQETGLIRVQKVSCGDVHTLAVDSNGGLWCWGSGIATGLGVDGGYEALVPERVPNMHNKCVKDISCGKFYSTALVRIDLNERIDSKIPQGQSIAEFPNSLPKEMARTESNVAQKIPFLENVFYVEEEDGPINWSVDLPKFSRSNTPSMFNEIQSTESVESELEDSSVSNSGKITHESATASAGALDTTITLEVEDVEDATSTAEERSEKIPNARVFSNKLYDLEGENKDRVMNPKKSKSFPSLDSTMEKKDLETATIPLTICNNESKGNFLIPAAAESVADADNELKLSKEYDLFYSASDILVKVETTKMDSDCASNSSASIDDVDVELPAAKDPLSLSLNEGMANVILNPSCSVVYDESFKKHENLRKQKTNSTWSIATSSSSYDVDKIGSSFDITESHQVWAWGENKYGQLGTNDNNDCLEPVCVDQLREWDIIKVSAGEKHVLAITRSSQVFGWGDNSCGQIGIHKNMAFCPQPIEVNQVLGNTRVWDIAAGGEFSVLLADSVNNSCDVYHLGKTVRKLESDFVSLFHTSGASFKKNKSSKKKKSSKSKRQISAESIAEWYVDAELRKVAHFNNHAILRTIVASNDQFACITASNTNGFLKIMYKLASSERNYHYQLDLIHKHIMEPLLLSDAWSSISRLPGGEALLPLVDCFNDVLRSIRIGLCQLTEVVSSGLRVKDLFSFFLSDSFRAVYDQYAKCYCDTLAVGHLQSISKAVSHIVSKMEDSVKEMLNNFLLEQFDLAALLKIPLKRSSYYCKCVEKLARCVKEAAGSSQEEVSQLLQVIQRWQIFADQTSTRLREANETREFWEGSSAKLIEALKDPHRRVLKTSKDSPLSLARASRLTSHCFVLFNDVFVHSQSNRHFQVFPLVTMWAEPLLDTEEKKRALRITAPEASVVLVAVSPTGMTDWLRELNEAIAQCISATTLHRITTESVNSISGILRAADAREASYTYINHPRFKGARYRGMWMRGLPHGRGKMDWLDGHTYEGEFVDGNFHGYGIMFFSNEPCDHKQCYEGDWAEGKMNGFGQMRYQNGDEYVGNWVDDARKGHGTLKTFSLDRCLLTVYVGEWVQDHKHGYGVQDFVARGEKYLGMWLNSQRHGYGIVVTVDGVYYEGRFLQNKLAGRGILLSDDDTCYEGEFTADMQLSGKGVLTLPNGDYIDGQFHGNWGEGIKINGTFNKFANPDPSMVPVGEIASSQLSLTDFTIPAGIKWQSLFQACCEELGIEVELVAAGSVWRNIETAITRTRSSDVRRKSTRKRDFNKKVASIVQVPNAGHVEDLTTIQLYLKEAIDTFGHPLNTLVEALVEVYRATYVGVGAHRRLLLHAVEEAKSYISRLFTVARLLFPGLPDEEFVMLSNSRAIGEDEKHVTSSSLLHPLILPCLYPPLFTLYALHTEKVDAMYSERLHQLNKRADLALMSFLGVDRKFLLCHFDEDTKIPIVGEKAPYESAVQELESITTKYSPMEKIETVQRSFANVHKEVDEFWHGEKKLIAMDDLFPVFQYVVVRARIPHLGSEVQFIEDLVEGSILVGELGHMLTTLKACYFQIQKEQDRD